MTDLCNVKIEMFALTFSALREPYIENHSSHHPLLSATKRKQINKNKTFNNEEQKKKSKRKTDYEVTTKEIVRSSKRCYEETAAKSKKRAQSNCKRE